MPDSNTIKAATRKHTPVKDNVPETIKEVMESEGIVNNTISMVEMLLKNKEAINKFFEFVEISKCKLANMTIYEFLNDVVTANDIISATG